RTKKKNTTYEYDFEMPGIEPVHPLIMRARTSVIHNRQGEQSGAVTIIHDVTHEREVDRMKTEFISTAAHELRTPLTSIMGFSEILLTRDNIKLKERKRYLSHINKQSVNLKEIIDDLLDISRIESGRGFSLVKSHWYFDECVEEVAPYFIEHSSEKTFHLNLPKERVRVYADRDKIGQVLKNLLSNAVKYSPNGGAITIKGKPVNGSFEVSVVDSGIGMTPDQLGHMFEKFYRADASNSAAEGTGLGMTIVKYIVEAHGGTVQVDSKYGEGTTVKFSVPIKEGEDEENTDS
ncbi:MAG: HAMP domain-containing histidine kinase, partial [Thermodesulfovibrionales bacterium]|nr:HAMP domain-containing histidine kinase [Thermodesulfovibrionales bacterium]